VMGPWAVLHEVRSEWAQLLTCAFLAIEGAGRLSLDAWLRRRRESALAEGPAARVTSAAGLAQAARSRG
jgi:hypothetical protein